MGITGVNAETVADRIVAALKRPSRMCGASLVAYAVALSVGQAVAQEEETCPTYWYPNWKDNSEVPKKGPGEGYGDGTATGTHQFCRPGDGATPADPFGGFFPYGIDLEPNVATGCAYQDWTHPTKYMLSNPTLTTVTRTITVGSTTGHEGGLQLLLADPATPAAISAYEGHSFELQGQNPPGQATLRDFFGVTLSSGQLDVSLPTGIRFAGVNGNDFELKVNFRSVVQRHSMLGPFASFNYEDFLVIEKLIPLEGVECGNGTPSEAELRKLVNSSPYVNRLKGGAVQTWANIGKPATPPGSALATSGWFQSVGNAAFGPIFQNNSNCFFAGAGNSNVMQGVASQATALYNGQVGLQHANHVADPIHVDPNAGNAETAEIYYNFAAPLGTLETFDWDCNGAVISEADGTVTVYGRFYVQKNDDPCVDYDNMQGTGYKGLSAGAGWGTGGVPQPKAHMRLVAPALFRQTRDGLRMWYLYNVYGQLIGWRDSLGREVVISYGALGDGSISHAKTANRAMMVRAEDGRECNFLYDTSSNPASSDTLIGIALPDVGAGAPGQASIDDRVIRIAIEKSSLPPRPGQFGPTSLDSSQVVERYRMSRMRIAAPGEAEGDYTFDATLDEVSATTANDPYKDCRVTEVTYASSRVPTWFPSARAGTTTTYGYVNNDPGSCSEANTWTVTEKIFDVNDGPTSGSPIQTVQHDFDVFGNEIERRDHVVLSPSGSDQVATTTYEYEGFARRINVKTAENHPDGTRTEWKYQFQDDLGGGASWHSGIGFNSGGVDHSFFARLNVLAEIQIGAEPEEGDPITLATQYEYGKWRQVRKEYFPRSSLASAGTAKFTHAFDYDPESVQGQAPPDYPIGVIVKTTYPAAYSTEGAPTEVFEYNGYGQLTQSVDCENRTTTYAYHKMNDPDGDNDADWKATDGVAPSGLPGYLDQECGDPGSSPHLALTTHHSYDVRGNEVETVFPKGNRVATAYNGMDQAYRIAKGSFTTGSGGDPVESAANAGFEKEYRHFDKNGNVTEVRRFNNNSETASLTTNSNYVTTKFEYDGLDRMAVAKSEVASPTESGLVWAQTSWLRDALGRIKREVRPDGSVTKVEYAPQGKVLTHRAYTNRLSAGAAPTSDPDSDPDSDGSMAFEYDLMGRLVEGTDGEGDQEQMHYDGLGRPIGRVDPQGTLLFQTLNELSLPTSEAIYGVGTSCPPGSGAVAFTRSEFEYDDRARLEKKRGGHFSVSSSGSETTLLDGHVDTTYTFNKVGQLVRQVEDNGATYDLAYDQAGRRTSEKYPDLLSDDAKRNVDEYAYDANGAVTTMTVKEWGIPDGGTATLSTYTIDHEYDALGRETKTVRAKGTSLEAATELFYDSLSNLKRSKEPKTGQVVGTVHWYDTLGRSVKTVEGYNDSFTGAASGLATVATNADGFVTLLADYDLAGNVIEQKDDLGNATAYVFDGQQRRTQVTYADQTYERVAYRTDGLATEFDSFNTSNEVLYHIEYEYGDGSESKRLVTEDATAIEGVFKGMHLKTFGYDALGRVTHAEAESADPHHAEKSFLTKTDRSYDSLGRVLTDNQEIYDQATPASSWNYLFDVDVTSTYDSVGNITETLSSRGASSGNEFRVAREYDLLSRLTSVRDISSNQNIVAAEYDWRGAGGRVETIRHPWNATKTIYGAYDQRGRVGEIATKTNGGSLLAGRQYGYGPSSVKTHELKLGGSGSYSLDDHVFEHDAIDRLTRVRQGEYDPTGSGGAGSFTGTPSDELLDMDGAGSIRRHTVPGVTTPFVNGTDSTNAYTPTFKSNGSGESEGEFDDVLVERNERGDTITLGVMNLSYDMYGHIVGTMRPWVSPIVPTQEYRDAFNRRVYRDYNGQKRVFVYQGEELLQELLLNPVSPIPAPQVQKEYVHGDGIDEVVAQRVGTTLYAMHTDAMGTPYALTNQYGALSEQYDIGPYGEYSVTDVDGGGTIGNRIGLAGMWYDAITNLYYMRARHYSPFMKRFVSRDPLGIWGDVVNRGSGYGYGGQNPTLSRDPFGLESESDVGDWLNAAGRAIKSGASKVGTAIRDAAAATYDGAVTMSGRILSGGSWDGEITESRDWCGTEADSDVYNYGKPLVESAITGTATAVAVVSGGYAIAAGVETLGAGGGITMAAGAAIHALESGGATSRPAAPKPAAVSSSEVGSGSLGRSPTSASAGAGEASATSAATESTTTLYHGGSLRNGTVGSGGFSTTDSIEHAQQYAATSCLGGGSVYTFEVPNSFIAEQERMGALVRYVDNLSGTTGSANEFRFLGGGSRKLNSYRK